ncbi:MAG: putative rane protein [Planctomycetota bacterium]|nr:putative rane protein [Planctomycetota bacterium]
MGLACQVHPHYNPREREDPYDEVGRSSIVLLGAEMETMVDTDDVPVQDLLALCLCDDFRRFEGASVAPNFFQPALVCALATYLHLQPDEILLAIVRDKKKTPPHAGCALTTKRIHWAAPLTARTLKTADWTGPLRANSMAYTDFPTELPNSDGRFAESTIVEAHLLSLEGSAALKAAIASYLKCLAPVALGEASLPFADDAGLEPARQAWPAVVAGDVEIRRLQSNVASIRPRSYLSSRGVITPLIILICVGIFVAMVLSGISPIEPAVPAMVGWGASFGPSVAMDGQWWRLFTCVFLHFGVIHLGMNMWCLMSTGPLVERLLGRLNFAALYVLSGVGGAIASLWFHPIVISAGASGAIFGVFGGLLGHLAVRRNELSFSLIKPLRNGALAFLGYNLLFGLFLPGIDMAAHVGGLVTGCAAGLLLTLGSLGPSSTGRMLRQMGVVVAMSVGLGLLGHQGIDAARRQVLADPRLGALVQDQQSVVSAWNDFSEASRRVLAQFDVIGSEIDGFVQDIDRGARSNEELVRVPSGLNARVLTLRDRIMAMPAANDEIRTMRDGLLSASRHQGAILAALTSFLRDGDERHVTGPEGFQASLAAYTKDFAELETRRNAYIQAHGLILKAP